MNNQYHNLEIYQRIINSSSEDKYSCKSMKQNLYSQYKFPTLKQNLYGKKCQDDDNLIIKICMPNEGIDAFTLSHLLKDLYIVNRELNKFYEEKSGIKNLFELKINEVRPGCLEILLGFVASSVLQPLFAEYLNNLFLDGTKERLGELGLQHKQIFIKLFTQNKTNMMNKNTQEAVADFYKRISNIEGIEAVQFTSGKKTKTIKKDKMIDYYA